MITALCLMLSAMMAFSPAPSDMLTAEMLLIEVAQDGARNKSGLQDHGQCRRFQVDSFAEASSRYMLAAYPEVTLYLPADHAAADISGRPVGTCWDMPAPGDGNAYVEVARFDYDKTISEAENLQLARAFLHQARAGDVMQMLGRYNSGGRGTHTILFSQPYDPRDPMLYWVDSNFANTVEDGIRYGFVRAQQRWPLEDVAAWLTRDWHNGATLYRVSEDVVPRAEP